MDRKIRDQRLELAVGLGRVGAAKSLFQFHKVNAAIASGNPKSLGDSLPICIGRSRYVCRNQGSR
jgi:hypothetical protein